MLSNLSGHLPPLISSSQSSVGAGDLVKCGSSKKRYNGRTHNGSRSDATSHHCSRTISTPNRGLSRTQHVKTRGCRTLIAENCCLVPLMGSTMRWEVLLMQLTVRRAQIRKPKSRPGQTSGHSRSPQQAAVKALGSGAASCSMLLPSPPINRLPKTGALLLSSRKTIDADRDSAAPDLRSVHDLRGSLSILWRPVSHSAEAPAWAAGRGS